MTWLTLHSMFTGLSRSEALQPFGRKCGKLHLPELVHISSAPYPAVIRCKDKPAGGQVNHKFTGVTDQGVGIPLGLTEDGHHGPDRCQTVPVHATVKNIGIPLPVRASDQHYREEDRAYFPVSIICLSISHLKFRLSERPWQEEWTVSAISQYHGYNCEYKSRLTVLCGLFLFLLELESLLFKLLDHSRLHIAVYLNIVRYVKNPPDS